MYATPRVQVQAWTAAPSNQMRLCSKERAEHWFCSLVRLLVFVGPDRLRLALVLRLWLVHHEHLPSALVHDASLPPRRLPQQLGEKSMVFLAAGLMCHVGVRR